MAPRNQTSISPTGINSNSPLSQTAQNFQTGMQNWFTETPVGQTVNSLKNTAKGYQQNLNDWFSKTQFGQGIDSFNTTYDQRFQQIQNSEQARHTAELAAMYETAIKQLGL